MAITFLNLGNQGRLANCLFQIAATIGLAKRHGLDYVFPIKQGAWDYWDYFDNPPPITDDFRWCQEEMREGGFHYSHPVIKDGITLSGYFQSELYWQDNYQLIHSHFTFKKDLLEKMIGKYSAFLDLHTCAIHVRRGDYVTNRNHLPQPMDYYVKAMRTMGDRTFLIFSDDIAWCRRMFNGTNIIFIEGNSDIEDLCLMSMCKSHIIANSSFSWWGCYLGKSPHVISPRNWFGPGLRYTHNTKDLYLKHWIKI